MVCGIIIHSSEDYFELQFDFLEFATKYGVLEGELIDTLREVCKNKLNGSFKIDNYDSKKGACIITSKPTNESFIYKLMGSSYTLVKDKCAKEVIILAKVRYGCFSGFNLDGIYCK